MATKNEVTSHYCWCSNIIEHLNCYTGGKKEPNMNWVGDGPPQDQNMDVKGALPRIITTIDKKEKKIQVERRCFDTSAVYAISHRWESRQDPDIQAFHVQCDGEEGYDALLHLEEVRQLEALLEKLRAPLWLDYICINQESDEDKVAQVYIMGNIYLKFISLPLGKRLKPDPPSMDYFARGWTFQERSFGFIHFPFKVEDLDNENIKRIALEFGSLINDLSFCHEKIDGHYSYTESWRIDAANKVINRLKNEGEEEKAHFVSKAKELMMNNDQVELAKVVLQYRENLNILDFGRKVSHPAIPDVVKFQTELFRVNVKYSRDRLYGIWGVPSQLKGFQLNYNDPKESWLQIASKYPGANFAYYSHVNSPDTPFLGFTAFADVATVVMCALSDNEDFFKPEPAEVLECTSHAFRFDENNFTLAWGKDCVGLACQPKMETTTHDIEGSFHFVIGYDAFSFDIREAFWVLVQTRLVKLGLCDSDWRQSYYIRGIIEEQLAIMIEKHDVIATYKDNFLFLLS